jgi:hypothetical protein
LTQTLAGIGGMFAMTNRVEVVKRWVVDGLISRIRVTFDPRPLLARVADTLRSARRRVEAWSIRLQTKRTSAFAPDNAATGVLRRR